MTADKLTICKLSDAQRRMLERVSQCPNGYSDYIRNKTLSALRKRGLVAAENIMPDFGYNPRTHRGGGGELQADWLLTDAGRKALAKVRTPHHPDEGGRS